MHIMTEQGWKLLGGDLQPTPEVKKWWRGSYSNLTKPEAMNDTKRLMLAFDKICGEVVG